MNGQESPVRRALLRIILAGPGGNERLGEVVRYIREVVAQDSVEAVHRAVTIAVEPRGGSMAVWSIADHDRAVQARRMFMRMLEARFGVVSEAARARVEAADAPSLEATVKKAVAASTIEEAVADLAEEPPAGDGA